MKARDVPYEQLKDPATCRQWIRCLMLELAVTMERNMDKTKRQSNIAEKMAREQAHQESLEGRVERLEEITDVIKEVMTDGET